MQNQKKNTILILCRFVFSPLRTHSLFLRLKPLNFDHIRSCGGKFDFRKVTCNSTPFHPIEIYMLFAGREVRMGKNCARGLEYGSRATASGRTQGLGYSFFPIRTDLAR